MAQMFINPFTDVGFKRIFGQEFSKDLLIDFLNDLLAGEYAIRDITFINKEKLGLYDENRSTIYDIYCETDDGRHVIVEMQNSYQSTFVSRAIYYLSRAIVEQGQRGSEWRYAVTPVIGVFFTNFHLPSSVVEPKPRTDVVLADRSTGRQFSDTLRMIFIDLPSFQKSEADCETDFDRWIYVLKNMETLDRMPFKARKAVFDKLEQVASLTRLSHDERLKYEESLKVFRDNALVLESAEERGFAKGEARGIAKGRVEGEARGIAKGRSEGERARSLSIAMMMRQNGMPIDQIVMYTGLTEKEINQLPS